MTGAPLPVDAREQARGITVSAAVWHALSGRAFPRIQPGESFHDEEGEAFVYDAPLNAHGGLEADAVLCFAEFDARLAAPLASRPGQQELLLMVEAANAVMAIWTRQPTRTSQCRHSEL